MPPYFHVWQDESSPRYTNSLLTQLGVIIMFLRARKQNIAAFETFLTLWRLVLSAASVYHSDSSRIHSQQISSLSVSDLLGQSKQHMLSPLLIPKASMWDPTAPDLICSLHSFKWSGSEEQQHKGSRDNNHCTGIWKDIQLKAYSEQFGFSICL